MTNTIKFVAAILASTLIGGASMADPVAAATPTLSPAPAPATPTAASIPSTHTLTVTIMGVRSARGTIRAQLMKADPAAGIAKSVGGNFMAAVAGTTTLTFAGLADGDYAVQMFHDEDGDGQMKTNMFGIPSEGFGFSNGARAAFGPPKFADMKVTVNANTVTIANMAY